MARAWRALGTRMTHVCVRPQAQSRRVAGTPRFLDGEPRPRPDGPDPRPCPWARGAGGRLGSRLALALGTRGAAGGRGERPPSPAPRMTGAREPRREEPPPPSAGLRSRKSGARSAGGWERAERGRGAAARPATGPPPRRIGPLYGMWLVTFLLLLDSLHKGESRAGGRAAGAAEPGCARGAARRGAQRAPGARGTDLGRSWRRVGRSGGGAGTRREVR